MFVKYLSLATVKLVLVWKGGKYNTRQKSLGYLKDLVKIYSQLNFFTFTFFTHHYLPRTMLLAPQDLTVLRTLNLLLLR